MIRWLGLALVKITKKICSGIYINRSAIVHVSYIQLQKSSGYCVIHRLRLKWGAALWFSYLVIEVTPILF